MPDIQDQNASVVKGYLPFDVVGVDIKPQPNYPFEFIQADALACIEAHKYGEWLPVAPHDFTAIHASPPCQGYTTMNHRHGSASPLLIDCVRSSLSRIKLAMRARHKPFMPYVIENVAGALSHMRSPIELTGEMFGLGVHRPRLFESNYMLLAPPRPARQTDPAAVYGKQDGRRLWTRADGSELRVATFERGLEAMGIDWMNWDELREAIPPAYTEFIGEQLLRSLNKEKTARG